MTTLIAFVAALSQTPGQSSIATSIFRELLTLTRSPRREASIAGLDSGVIRLQRDSYAPEFFCMSDNGLEILVSSRGALFATHTSDKPVPGPVKTEAQVKEDILRLLQLADMGADRKEITLEKRQDGSLFARSTEFFGPLQSTRRATFEFEPTYNVLRHARFEDSFDVTRYQGATRISEAQAYTTAWNCNLADDPCPVSDVSPAQLCIGIPFERTLPKKNNLTQEDKNEIAQRIGVPFYRIQFEPRSGPPGPHFQVVYVDARDGRIQYKDDMYLMGRGPEVKEPFIPPTFSIGGSVVGMEGSDSGAPVGKRVQVENFAGYWDTKTDRLWLSVDGKTWNGYKMPQAAAKELDSRPTPKNPFKK